MEKEKIILGIDPGTSVSGYGIVEIIDKKPQIIAIGIIDLRKIKDHYVKIKNVYDRTLGLIDEYHPDELAIESPFYSNNVQSMLKLGRAQGAAISAALNRSLPIFEYSPRKIKMSITGSGSASKEQVAGMLINMFNLKNLPKELDATDGLAAAICHFYQNTKINKTKSSSSWNDFLKNNPDRIL
ncbi:MAG: crossover junction endodeoxyribonuclease RuvC [Marinilabiliales bacterium]